MPRVTYDVVTARLLTVLGSTKDRSRYENHNMIPETMVKARRTRLTIAQKIEVGHVLQLANPTHAVMRQFNISERTVRNIKRSLPSLRRHLTKKYHDAWHQNAASRALSKT